MVHLYQLVVRWIMTIAIPLFLLIIVFPTKVMLLFGPQYQEGHMILAILTTAVLIQSFIGPGGPTLTMTGFPKINFMNSIAVLIINLVFNIILIPAYAGFGAAIATLISMSFLGFLRTIEVWYILKLQPVSVRLFKPVMAGIVTWILLTQIKFIIMPFHTVITLVAATIVVVFSFFILLLLMGFDDDDKQVVSALKATWASNFRNSQ
jgi:O-antigen/teichoic acid export membrane protein